MDKPINEMNAEECFAEIAKYDAMFQAATRWGSWMATASSARKRLVRRLWDLGHPIEDKYELIIGEEP